MELSLDQFFMHIRCSFPYTSLEIHNNIEFYTDNFNPKKLEILKKNFESFLRTERKKFSNRFSIEDIDKVVSNFNYEKAEKIEYKNLSNDEKLQLVEKLLFPNEFYACYRFLDTLEAEMKSYENSTILNLKTQQIENTINFNQHLSQSSTKTKEEQKKNIFEPKSFKDIFLVPDWQDLIDVLKKLEPPLLDKDLNFIGKEKGGKGIICSWISTLKNKGKIKPSINRQDLAKVLNNEIKNLNLGSDGSTFSKVNNSYETEWENKLLKLAQIIP